MTSTTRRELRVLAAVLLVAAAAAAGCSGDTAPPTWIQGTNDLDPVRVPPEFSLKYTSITLDRDYCFGTCPVYRVTIDGDGRVTWFGTAYVAAAGADTATADVDAYVELLKDLVSARFLDAADRYDERPALVVGPDGTCRIGWHSFTDLPTRTITLRLGLYSKTVQDYYGAPEEIHALSARIDSVAGTARWIEGPEPAGGPR